MGEKELLVGSKMVCRIHWSGQNLDLKHLSPSKWRKNKQMRLPPICTPISALVISVFHKY